MPLGAAQALVEFPALLRRLRALPPFPKAFNYVTAHNGFLFSAKAGLLPEREVEEVFTWCEQVCATYPRLDPDMVPCHMDLKPENILSDSKQVWLVDWQAASVKDRYFDMVIRGEVPDYGRHGRSDELTYFERYLRQAPNEYQHARFFLMRQVVHMFYAAMFLLPRSAGKPIDQTGELPSFGDFHQRIWGGEVDPADNDLKILYGRLPWEQILRKIRVAPHHRQAEPRAHSTGPSTLT